MTIDELLTTTRAVRKRLDLERPVELDVIRECLSIAVQAPTGSNEQGWHFVVVTDVAKRAALAELYAKAFDAYLGAASSSSMDAQMSRVVDSATYLAQNLAKVPVHLVPCIEGRIPPERATTVATASVYGSILPATWSFMLAARARGLGTAWTTLHLAYEREAADVLGIPYDSVTQTALIPVAYSKGTEFKPAVRRPLETCLHIDAW
jgi:nitroreductase